MNKILISVLSVLLVPIFALIIIWIVMARPYPTSEYVETKKQTQVDEELLRKHVRVLSQEFLPRDFRHVENLNSAMAYIDSEFKTAGLSTTTQKYTVEGVEYKNVMVNLGSDKEPKIVIGAHYDVAGANPGADDNASGVAGLIELGRHLKDMQLDHSVTLVAYTLEEPPYFATTAMGSYQHAKNLREKGENIELMISLEMIGYFSSDEGSQSYPSKLLNLFYPSKGNFITVIDQLSSDWGRDVKVGMAKHMSLPIYSVNAPSIIPGINFSDHRNFWEFDYDAVMITDTAFYRNKAYHTKQDTMDRLDYEKMASIVQALVGYVSEF